MLNVVETQVSVQQLCPNKTQSKTTSIQKANSNILTEMSTKTYFQKEKEKRVIKA